MNRVIILGSGAAPGVPTISNGWENCNPLNLKNRRSRSGLYIEIDGTKLLIDTSADIRNQLLDNNIKRVDGVLYTHVHADHIMGIDDLRALSYDISDLFTKVASPNDRILNIYGAKEHIDEIRKRFGYVLIDEKSPETTKRPQLKPNIVEYFIPFQIGHIKITPLAFSGHPVPTTGYSFNDGKLVLIPDYKVIAPQTLEYLQKIDVNVLIMPLTNIDATMYHAGIEDDMDYIKKICPEKVFFTHLGPKCDYDEIMRLTPANMAPAYDGLEIRL